MVAEALGLPRNITALDLTSSTRCGISAIAQAANQAAFRCGEDVLVVASELTKAKVGSAALMQQGDAAAAVCVGNDRVIAEIIGHVSTTVDFVDSYRAAGQAFGRQWEERYLKLVPETVNRLLADSGIEAASVAAFICPAPIRGVSARVAKVCGMGNAVVNHLDETCGYAGTAQPLLLLANTLENAASGRIIVLAGMGQGGEALLLKTTEYCRQFKTAVGAEAWLANGVKEENVLKYLVFRNLVVWDEGGNGNDSEFTSLSALYRDRGFVNNLQGLHCAATGEVFFGPEAEFEDSRRKQLFKRKSFADSRVKLLSWSANYLGISRDQSIRTAILEFEEGGRLVMNIADIEADKLSVGLIMEMAYRVHGVDQQTGFTRYFWKAVPPRPVVCRKEEPAA